MNYFEFFAIPVAFTIDKPALRVTYLANSKKYHPDINTELSEAHSTDSSSQNNIAYEVLKEDEKRTHYLLDVVFPSEKKAILPPEFLGEIMEINESLMEAKMDEDVEEIQNLSDKIIALDSNINTEIEVLKAQFDAGDTTVLEPLREYALKKNYLKRSMSQL